MIEEVMTTAVSRSPYPLKALSDARGNDVGASDVSQTASDTQTGSVTTTPKLSSTSPVGAGRWSNKPGSRSHPLPAPVVWVGNHRLSGGKRIRMWSCEGHVEGVEKAERVDHR